MEAKGRKFKKGNLTEETIIFETILYLLHRYRTSAGGVKMFINRGRIIATFLVTLLNSPSFFI